MEKLYYQLPAEGILKTHDFGDSKVYTITCQCGEGDDELRVEVEADECGVAVHHWVTVKTNWWDEPTKYQWINGLIHRVKITWNIWIYGYIKYEAWTIMSQQQTYNYSETLKQAVEDVEHFKKSRA